MLNEASVLRVTLPPRCYFSSPVTFEGSALAFVIDNLCHGVVTRSFDQKSGEFEDLKICRSIRYVNAKP